MNLYQRADERRDWITRAQCGDPRLSLQDLACKALCARARVLRAQLRQERGAGAGPTEAQLHAAQALTDQAEQLQRRIAIIRSQRRAFVH